MAKAKKSFSNKSGLYGKLCNPAKFYLIISFVSLFIISIQNLRSPGKLCLGSYSCPSDNASAYILGNAVYILVCTWILNLICKGSPNLSWTIVLIPFLLMFIAFGIVLFTGMKNDPQQQ